VVLRDLQTGLMRVRDRCRDVIVEGVKVRAFPFTWLTLTDDVSIVDLDNIHGPVNLVRDFASRGVKHVYRLPLMH
jgi:hypothetical protein